MSPTLVLVHGAFADASGSAGVIRELTAEQQHNAHRPHQASNQAAPLRQTPASVTDPGRIARLYIRRHNRLPRGVPAGSRRRARTAGRRGHIDLVTTLSVRNGPVDLVPPGAATARSGLPGRGSAAPVCLARVRPSPGAGVDGRGARSRASRATAGRWMAGCARRGRHRARRPRLGTAVRGRARSTNPHAPGVVGQRASGQRGAPAVTPRNPVAPRSPSAAPAPPSDRDTGNRRPRRGPTDHHLAARTGFDHSAPHLLRPAGTR